MWAICIRIERSKLLIHLKWPDFWNKSNEMPIYCSSLMPTISIFLTASFFKRNSIKCDSVSIHYCLVIINNKDYNNESLTYVDYNTIIQS